MASPERTRGFGVQTGRPQRTARAGSASTSPAWRIVDAGRRESSEIARELQTQNCTLGASRSAGASVSKNSSSAKLNMPAMMFVGTVFVLVLYFMTESL